MQIAPNIWVTVSYRLYDSQGQPIEEDEREMTYLHGGYGGVFPRIEQELEGRSPGFATSLYLEPEDTFGDYDAERLRLAPRERFPATLEPGMTFEGVPGEASDGQMYIVTDIADDTVVLDSNHPLAGMGLRFELNVVDAWPATPEEIERESRAVDD